MKCRRFQKLLFEYAEGSLPARTHTATERHLASCSACRELARQHQQFTRSMSDRLHRHAESITFAPEEQRRLIATLQRELVEVAGRQLLWDWRRPLAWIGVSAAAFVIVLFLMIGFPFRAPIPVQSHAGISDVPILIRSSYCAPVYTFHRENDFVIDSLGCKPLVVEQTLWLAQNQKSPL